MRREKFCHIIPIVVLLVISFSCDSNRRISLRNVKISELASHDIQYEIARRYILCSCMEQGRGLAKDAHEDHKMSLYADLGDLVGNKARLLDSLATSVVRGITYDAERQVGGKAIMETCIEYYNSKEITKDIAAIYKLDGSSMTKLFRRSYSWLYKTPKNWCAENPYQFSRNQYWSSVNQY